MRRFLLIALLFSGCATVQRPDAPDILPRLVYQAPLPPWPTMAFAQGLTLDLMIRVSASGSVTKAALLTPSGNAVWDSLALVEILRWRFTPAKQGTIPIATWVQQRVRVQFESPLLMVLSELGSPDRSLMDSLYSMLQAGASFDSLARHYSVLESRSNGGYLGEVDARAYPAYVRRQLNDLHIGEMTEPLVLGENFVIFRRTDRFNR